MTGVDPSLLVRAAAVYLCAALTLVVCAWRRPTRLVAAGAALAGVWNLSAVLALHVAARRFDWWQYHAEGGLLLGMPVDLYLAWVWLWGVLPALAFRTLPLPIVLGLALGFDLVLMPAAAPVVTLGPQWLAGEALGLLGGLLPAQLLARWTMRGARLRGRALLQVVAFTGLLLFVLPAAIVDGSGSAWTNPLSRPVWQLGLFAQLMAAAAAIGLSAVQEFATRGGGTPVPFDPPRRLVTTGVYAYVRNPMQLSAALVLLLLGAILGNAWVAAAGLMAHIYAVGLAGWDEDEDLRRRFGDDWTTYRQGVRRWIPRWRPWHRSGAPPAKLYVSDSCDMCRQVGGWFVRHGAAGLVIRPAERHPSRALTRIAYEPADGARTSTGVEAIARALEHVHLGWASVGGLLRLPAVRPMAQLLVDASGGGPRPIPGLRTGRT